MRQWGNFYFWSTWILLICLFILIFHMYLSEFSLKEIIDTITLYFIDVKTTLTVLGTIFGAYFGAKTAGKYAIDSVERQIKAQENKENKREKDKISSYLNVFSAHLGSIIIVDDLFKEKFDLANSTDKNERIVNVTKTEIEVQLRTLKKLDITDAPGDTYYLFLLSLTLAEQYIEALDNLMENIKESNSEEVKEEFENIEDLSKSLKEHLNVLNNILSKFNK